MPTARRARLSSATSLLRHVASWLFTGLWLGTSAIAGPQHANLPGIAGPQTASLPAIAIIIDDLGYLRPEGIDALSLPGAVTYAILPHTPFARRFAGNAHSSGKEVILHQPMESTQDLTLGPGGITSEMSKTQVHKVLMENLSSIPHLSGISNHMGSLLSTREQSVGWMMEVLVSQPPPFFFVDSRTIPGSGIAGVARRNGIPTITRDVFLDNSLDPNEIRSQFDELISRAKSRGTALAIGHPHSTTIMVLKRELENLSDYGVRLVKVSALLKLREISRNLTAMQPESNKVRAVPKPKT